MKEGSAGWREIGRGQGAGLRFRFVAALSALILFALVGLSPAQENVISAFQIHGNRRIPAETIRARILTRAGDIYDQEALVRDYNSLWNTGYFEDLRMEREETSKGWIIHVYVKEKPTIREVHYVGLNSVSQSDVLDRLKERKVGGLQESQYDPTKVKKAEVVIKELLAEHGRQFAVVRTEIRPLPPAAISVTFNVKEGPKVKVGNIKFVGKNDLGTRYLRYAMKNLRPIGIPHSIFFENIFAKTYDATKLSEDTERIRNAFQVKGYFKAVVQDPKTEIRDSNPPAIHLPFIQKPGKRVDITVPVDEGERYRLGGISFSGNRVVTNTVALRKLFAMKDGDIFDIELIRKGLEALRKAYGEIGYINFTPVPEEKIDEQKKLVSLNIDLDEGKQFYVRRIEFVGNTTTRDKVIRRELAVEEGQVYNSRLWDLSLLRLNQLGYFAALKPEEATETKRNEQEGTVDLTLKVKENNKNSIGLTGGVSGLSGSFIGLNYSTKNFLGLGETLSVAANLGNIQRSITFGFTEPYAFDRPLQLGFTVYTSKYNYNQAQQEQVLLGQKLNLPQSELNTLLNYTQDSTGTTFSASYPIKHSFKRIGISYGLDDSTLKTFSTASQEYFEFLAFRSISGPSALSGIITSKVTPTFLSNTVDSPIRPHYGQSFFVATDIAGLGGNVRDIRPVMEYKRWTPMLGLKPKKRGEGKQTLGFRIQGSYITGYGGVDAPPFQRFYLGGDNDIRGFDVRSVTPYTFITNSVTVPLLNPDGSSVPYGSNPGRGNVNITIPVQQIVFTGGDTSLVSNLEYRIPIAGPVGLAIFDDFGIVGDANLNQLKLAPNQLNALQVTQFGCPTFSPLGCSPATPQPTFGTNLSPIPGTNWVPRMSTGMELQVLMPIINAPFRIYYAYNPLRLDTVVNTPQPINSGLFPFIKDSGAAAYTFGQVNALYAPSYLLREPRTTFRFTVSTTF
jgi:outer membrane protein insertion porin family